MACFAVIDTNVLVSALISKHPDSATVQVIDKMFSNDIIPVHTDEILDEYKEVLYRPKFHFPETQIQILLESLIQNGINTERFKTDEILPDPKDVVFYEVVLFKQDKNAYLVTGNIKHFPVKPFIVTPNEMIEILNQE